ncbi:MAG TPA: cytochrome C, partial [Cyclobacteriaceae bacterium]|nr:cytochrome C [Cyclobacteriaceae bacterium]
MEKQGNNPLIETIISAIGIVKLAILIVGVICILLIFLPSGLKRKSLEEPKMVVHPSHWTPPDIKSIPQNESGELIKYGYELIAQTNKFLGPEGKVSPAGNGMSCTNCHLDAGTKYLGNNFSAVASTYPKYRPRYGGVESIAMRVNDCIVRSLNAEKLDTTSREMQAIVSYMKWLGKDVEKGKTPEGAGLVPLSFMGRAA